VNKGGTRGFDGAKKVCGRKRHLLVDTLGLVLLVVIHRARFNFMSEARIWYSRDPDQKLLPGDCQNVIVLSDEFYREIQDHPIPTDLEAAKALSSSPAALDLFMWLSYRCFTARGRERVPLFGDFGLISQLGSADYARPRKFREKLEGWLDLVRTMWPQCPKRQLTMTAPDCLLIRRLPSRREEPMRTIEERPGIWRIPDQTVPFVEKMRIAKRVSQTDLARRVVVSKRIVSHEKETE